MTVRHEEPKHVDEEEVERILEGMSFKDKLRIKTRSNAHCIEFNESTIAVRKWMDEAALKILPIESQQHQVQQHRVLRCHKQYRRHSGGR